MIAVYIGSKEEERELHALLAQLQSQARIKEERHPAVGRVAVVVAVAVAAAVTAIVMEVVRRVTDVDEGVAREYADHVAGTQP